jgi:hypothetical protein
MYGVSRSSIARRFYEVNSRRRCRVKRPDTVGDFKSAEIGASHMLSWKAKKAVAQKSPCEGNRVIMGKTVVF